MWYHAMKWPWPLSDRDVCYVNCWAALADGRQLVADTSVEHAAVAAAKGYVRAKLSLVYCLEALGPTATRVNPWPDRIVALNCRSSTSYQIREHIRCLSPQRQCDRALGDPLRGDRPGGDLHPLRGCLEGHRAGSSLLVFYVCTG